MIITISGMPGSGKSSVARLIARRLRLRHISIGQRIRAIAKNQGKDINKLMDDRVAFNAIQREIERYIDELSERDDLIIEGRDAFYHIRDALHVFLLVEDQEAARRIYEDARDTEAYESIDEAKKELAVRRERERALYKRLHTIDIYNPRHYTLVIDTTHLSVDEVADQIIEASR